VAVLPALHDPCEVKWVISQLDWFCGTRMHSTIAALSSGVPAAAIAYSPKTLGVFETCGQGAHVADPRQLDTGDVVERLWQSWAAREEARRSLQATLPAVLRRAEEQMDAIVATVQEAGDAR
jgi:polysaccharide pyruvyl transferase WcaK-like protein